MYVQSCNYGVGWLHVILHVFCTNKGNMWWTRQIVPAMVSCRVEKNIYSDYSGVRVKIKYVQTIVTVWYDIIGKIFFENFNKNQCILTAIGQLHAVFCISCIVGFSRAPAGVVKWTSITPNPLSFLMSEQSHYKALKLITR